MRAKLTKRRVDAAQPEPTDYFIWDTGTKGFGLKVTPVGNRIYVVQARLHGRLIRYTIGKHGSPWTPDRAREEAVRKLGEIASGTNPNEKKAEEKRDISISQLCDLYLAEGCEKKKPSTIKLERGQVERHIKPLLGRRRVKSLHRADLEKFMADVANGKTATDVKTGWRGRAIVTGGKDAANRTMNLLAAMLTFAVQREFRSDNPARGVKKYAAKHRDRFLSLSEIGRLGESLSEAVARGENSYAVDAVRLLALSGCRKNEVLSLSWDCVDFDRGVLRLPDSKTGARVIALGNPALDLLRGMERIGNNEYVFPGASGEGHFVGIQKVWQRIRARAGMPDLRLHDLRHTFASVGVAGGDSLYMVGKLLGHRKSTTAERYAHLTDHPLRKVADRIAGQIAEVMNSGNGAGGQNGRRQTSP